MAPVDTLRNGGKGGWRPICDQGPDQGSGHTWLAWQRQPGQPFGTAIKMATLRHDSALGRRFVAWMRTLFEDGQD
ncbi:DUF3226 domain-containing protein [Thiohalocapsa sp. ML1]|uniref:DUF3226 domain-containing protein n=1 Tax=Thiohalocapsa sp. ML1 TaxID=1431688 RepID=UPI0035291528